MYYFMVTLDTLNKYHMLYCYIIYLIAEYSLIFVMKHISGHILWHCLLKFFKDFL